MTEGQCVLNDVKYVIESCLVKSLIVRNKCIIDFAMAFGLYSLYNISYSASLFPDFVQNIYLEKFPREKEDTNNR